MELAMPEPVEVGEIREQVLSSRQALLQYVLTEDQSFLWLLTAKELQLHSLPGEAILGEQYLQLSEALAVEQASSSAFLAPAQELYEMLLGPVAESLDTYDELIVVADSFLGYLPFEVLLTATQDETPPLDLATLPYLLRRKTVTYAPSASFLAFHAEHSKPSRDWRKDAILLGDPLYAKERQAAALSPTRAVLTPQSFERLQQTREEVTTIASELIEAEEAGRIFLELRDLQREKARSGSVSASRFDLYLGDEVNESRLKSDLTCYRIVHLATHGYFDPEHPWFSGLVLSSTEDAEDGADFLNLLELGTLKLDAQLVFLSDCETGKGELLRSEGVQSTARSFLIAGAQSVVATQWSVRDDVASVVARTFYRKLFDGQSPAEALRRELSIVEGVDRGARIAGQTGEANAPTNLHAHPALWAPFVLFGGSTGRTSDD
jgi:CHAT domain-containing protein